MDSQSGHMSYSQPPPPFHDPRSEPDAPFVLTWDVQTGTEVADLQSEIAPLVIPPPPEYMEVQRPTRSINYSLSPTGFNAMMIVPPADAQDTRPQYYITTSVNVLMPLSHITTVYRGANEYGELLGEFEMGIIDMPSKLQMKPRIKTCSPWSILTMERDKRSKLSDKIWRWQPKGSAEKYTLIWDYTQKTSVAECHSVSDIGKRAQLLAKYTYADHTSWTRTHELEVTPKGQEFFDHILMSLLIIERRRLTPGAIGIRYH